MQIMGEKSNITTMVLYNTTVTSIAVNSSEHCHNYASKVEVYFYANVIALLIIITLGLLGNLLVISVHWIDPSKNSSSILLLALAVLDNILLLDGVFANVLYSAFPYTGSGHWLWDNKDYFLVVSSPIFYWAHTCSTWCIVLVTIDRYIVVSRPLKATKLCTVRRARYSLILMISIATIYNLPRAFEYRIKETIEECSKEKAWRKEKTILMESPYYVLGYTVVLYFIVNYIVPLVILILMNGLLIKHINRAKTHHRTLTKPKILRHTSSINLVLVEESITRTVICIIVRFIVCATPGLAIRILTILDDPVLDTYQIFSNLLIYINSSTNFLIFAIMGRRFRKIMTTSLCKTKQRQRRARRITHMASLELIRSFSALTIQTSSPTSSRNSRGDDSPEVVQDGYRRLKQLNTVINKTLSGIGPVRKNGTSRSWTLGKNHILEEEPSTSADQNSSEGSTYNLCGDCADRGPVELIRVTRLDPINS